MNLLGMLSVAIAEFSDNTQDALTIVSKLSSSQLMFGDSIFQLITSIICWNLLKWKRKEKKLGNWHGNKPYILHACLYGILQFVHVFTMWYGIRLVPFASAICILISSNLITAFVAHVFLKDPLFKLFFPAVASTMIGGIFISQPHAIFKYIHPHNHQSDIGQINFTGFIMLCISTILWSASCILVRTTVTVDDDGEEKEGVHFLQLLMVNAVQRIFLWIPLIMIFDAYVLHDVFIGNIYEWKYDGYSILMLFLVGLSGFGATSFNIIGYQIGDATKVVWFEDLNLVFVYIYQIDVFVDIPNVFEIIGSLFFVMSALFPLIEELYKNVPTIRASVAKWRSRRSKDNIHDNKADIANIAKITMVTSVNAVQTNIAVVSSNSEECEQSDIASLDIEFEEKTTDLC